MIQTLISLIFTLVIVGVVFWAVRELLRLIPMVEPFTTLVRVLVVVIAVIIVLWVIAQVLNLAGFPITYPVLRH